MPMRSSDKPPPAVIVGLDCITGLQSARLLTSRGIPVIGIAANPRHYCCRTNVCREIVTADTSGEALIDALHKLAARLDGPAVLVPCTDLSVLVISQHRQALEPQYRVTLSDADVIEMLMDKVRFIEFAERFQLPIPRTCLVRSDDDIERAAQTLRFPCVVKPPVKTDAWKSCIPTKVCKAETPQELREIYQKCRFAADTFIVQEWIDGTDAELYSCYCYFNVRSEPLVTFVARKLRQWPPGTGTSCLGEECRNDVVLRETLRLFNAVGYRGLGYVEMKRDPRTGEHWIIEPNVGRPTARSPIAEAGGVDLLYASYCDTVGWDLPKGLSQAYGTAKWIYWRRDLQSAFYYWRRRELSLADWWRSWRGRKTDAVFSWSDPAPFIYDFRQAAALAARRLARKLRPRRAAALDGN